MRNFLFALALLMLATPTLAATAPEAQLLATVRGFYGWALENGKATQALEPGSVDVKGSTRFYLDTSRLGAFTAQFMRSGYFSPAFPRALARYYWREKAKIAAIGQKEFDQMALDGRGPMLATEDMDIFFCAQEYEYTPEYVAAMKIKSVRFHGAHARAIVVSPDQWETTFDFVRHQGRWLISGYCVYR